MKSLLSFLLLLSAVASAQVAPGNLTLDVLSNTEIKLSWTHDGKGIDKFVVEKSVDGSNYQVLKTLAATERTYTDNGLKPNTVYYYRLYSGLGTKNAGPVSNKAITLSNPPTGFAVTATTTVRVDLAWNSGGTPTQLEYSKNADFSAATTKKYTTEQTGFVDGLTPNTGYYFRLKRTAFNGAQESDWVQTKASTQDAKPAAPTGLAITGKNTSSISVKWNAVAGAEGYQVRRADAADFAGATAADVSPAQTTYTFSGLNDAQTYFMQVRAKNTVGGIDYWSDWSATLVGATDLALPVAPSAVQATPKSPTQVDVAWTDNSDNEDNFIISRSSVGSAGPWTEAGRVNANIRTFTDNGALPNTTYYYQVCATNKAGQACALAGKVTTPIQAPAAPSGLNVSIKGTTATLTWKDIATNETEYEIQRKEDNGLFGDYARTGAFEGVATFTDAKLVAGKTYCYRVRATNAGGPSGYSNEACAATLPAPPTAPTNLQLTFVPASQVDLSWTDGGGGVIDFEVQRAEGAGSFAKINTVSAGKTTDQDKTVQQGKTYSYRINAINAGGNALSDVKTITIPTTPAAPEYSLVVLSSTEIRVDYKNPAGGNATALELQYATDQNFASGVSGQNIPIVGSTVTVGSLQPNTRYYFRLRASNSATKLASDWVLKDALTLPPPVTKPNAPTNLNLFGSPDGRTLNVTWTDASTNETGFEIQYSESGDFTNAKTTTTGAGIAAAIIPLLEPCKTYYVRVRAVNGAGPSDWLNEKITLNPNVPAKATSLAGTAASQTQINLTWTYIANTEEAFELEYATNSNYTGSIKRELAKASRTESVTGLTAATAYWFRLRPKNCAGTGDWFEATATTLSPPVVPPNAPTSLSISAISTTRLDLAWVDNATNEGAYELEYSTSATFTTGLIQVRLSAGANSTQLTSLSANTTYYVRVRAVNSAGPSGWLTGSGTTQAVAPVALAVPTNLRFASGSPVFTQLSLLWNDVATNETGYEVWRSDYNQANWTRIAEMAVNTSAFTDIGLRPGVSYFYRVRAVQNTVYSDWSNVVSDRAPLVSAVNLPAEVRIFPNPVTDFLTLEVPAGGSGTVQIRSVAGLTVLEQPFASVAGRLTLDLRALPTGLYVVMVATDTIRFSTRLLKR